MRTLKSVLETRPIFHKRDETIRGHVFCSFLALVVRKELEDRLESIGQHSSDDRRKGHAVMRICCDLHRPYIHHCFLTVVIDALIGKSQHSQKEQHRSRYSGWVSCFRRSCSDFQLP